MKNVTGKLYWSGTSPHYYMYPKPEQDVRADAIVVGDGLSALLCGYLLAKSGRSAVVVAPGELAGESAASDAGMMQCSGGAMLCDLIDRIGERSAVRLYAACHHAVEHLGIVAGGLSRDVGYKRRSSLYYASSERAMNRLEREFRALRTYGFDVEYWSAADIAAHFPFYQPGAIVLHGDAEINPYLFVHETATSGIHAGMQVYEHTKIAEHRQTGNRHRLITADGIVLEADSVIYAAGSEPAAMRDGRLRMDGNRVRSIVTKRQTSLADWHQRFLIRDASEQRLHLRTTPDGRILAGMREHAVRAALPRADRVPQLPSHSADERAQLPAFAPLQETVREHFPEADASVAFEWAADVAESLDGLPFIGEDPEQPGVYYSIGCGANSIVFAMLAAQIVRDRLQSGDAHPVADLLRLNRPALAGVL